MLPSCVAEVQPDGFGNWVVWCAGASGGTPRRRWVPGETFVSYADRHAVTS